MVRPRRDLVTASDRYGYLGRVSGWLVATRVRRAIRARLRTALQALGGTVKVVANFGDSAYRIVRLGLTAWSRRFSSGCAPLDQLVAITVMGSTPPPLWLSVKVAVPAPITLAPPLYGAAFFVVG